jgi:hypothetical protein
MATSKADASKVADGAQLATVTSYVEDEIPNAGIDEAYLRASKFPKFFRSVLFQMILFGA